MTAQGRFEEDTHSENKSDDLSVRVGKLEGRFEHLATRDDHGRLEGEMKGIRISLFMIVALLLVTELGAFFIQLQVLSRMGG